MSPRVKTETPALDRLRSLECEIRWWRGLVQGIVDDPLNKDCPAYYTAKAALDAMPNR